MEKKQEPLEDIAMLMKNITERCRNQLTFWRHFAEEVRNRFLFYLGSNSLAAWAGESVNLQEVVGVVAPLHTDHTGHSFTKITF